MKTLFIDTNVLLSFYHLTSEDLEELRKVVALIDTTKIKLVLTEQVKDEFTRNRDAKIADAMKKLQDARFKVAFPAFAKDYPGYDELRTLLDRAGKKHAELVETIREDTIYRALKADALVADLFGKATVIPVSDKIDLNAVKRVRRGNPPGKDNSLGDAINWEVPAGGDRRRHGCATCFGGQGLSIATVARVQQIPGRRVGRAKEVGDLFLREDF